MMLARNVCMCTPLMVRFLQRREWIYVANITCLDKPKCNFDLESNCSCLEDSIEAVSYEWKSGPRMKTIEHKVEMIF